MQKTTNYQLNQWDKTDRIQMENFNEDNAKVDQVLAEHTAALALCGNCKIVHTSYTGNGTYGTASPTRITFSQRPMFALVRGHYSLMFIFGADGRYPLVSHAGSSGVSHIDYSWSGNTISLIQSASAKYQFNENGTLYDVYALYAEA